MLRLAGDPVGAFTIIASLASKVKMRKGLKYGSTEMPTGPHLAIDFKLTLGDHPNATTETGPRKRK